MIEFDEHTTRSAGIDLTPMIDVVFLLLIFFLLTSIFSKPSIPLNLPEAETAKYTDEAVLSVVIKKDGEILLNGKMINKSELSDRLTVLYKNNELKNINLISDKGVPFGFVVEVIDIAKKAGATNISIMVEKK